MMDDNISLDITGVGKIAKAIPPKAWNKLVDTACKTFSDLIAPITKITAGVGRLIEAKFNRMSEVEKIYAADAVRRAKEKVEASKREMTQVPKSKVLIAALEGAANESDDSLRDIWANLIANEILDGQVHPIFPEILNKLSANDAITLAEIGEKSGKDKVKIAAKKLITGINVFGVSIPTSFFDEPDDFSREHLDRLGVIINKGGVWTLTHIGIEFLKAVTEPALLGEAINQTPEK